MVIISSIILVAAQSGRIFWTSLTIFPWRAGKTWQWGLKTLMNFSRWSLVQAPILPARGSTHQYWLWGLQSSFLQTHCGLACWSSLHGNWPGPMIVMAGCLMMVGSDTWVIICVSLESNSRQALVCRQKTGEQPDSIDGFGDSRPPLWHLCRRRHIWWLCWMWKYHEIHWYHHHHTVWYTQESTSLVLLHKWLVIMPELPCKSGDGQILWLWLKMIEP